MSVHAAPDRDAKLKRLAVFRQKNAVAIALFALGTGTQALLGFLSIPLLVRVLGVEELGRWSVVEATFQIGAQIALLGFNQTLIKFISADGLAPWPSMRKVFQTLTPTIAVAAIGAATLAHYWLALPVWSAVAVGLLLCLECWIALGLSTSRAASRPLVFSAALITRGSCLLAALALAVFVWPGELKGVPDLVWIWGATYVLVAGWLGLALLQRRTAGVPPSIAHMKQGFKYGWPLLVAVLIAQFLQYADRFFVSTHLGYAEAGRYFVHAKVANTLAIAAMPVQLWWPVARFEHLKDNDAGSKFFSRASLLGVGFFSLALLALAAITPLVMHWFAPTIAIDSGLLFLLLAASFLQVSAIFFNVGLLDAGSTHLNTVVWVTTATVQLSLQSLLVPQLGVVGAGVGLLAGALCALVLQFVLSQRRRRIRFPLVPLFSLATTALLGALLMVRGG